MPRFQSIVSGRSRLAVWLAPLWGVLGISAALAAEADLDPPERLARISFLKGDVGLQTQDDKDWIQATLNRPLTTGGRLRVERNGRAELQVGMVNVQLDTGADLTFLELTDSVAQMRLVDGAVYVSVRRLQDAEIVEVDTPHAAVVITKPGEYAIAISDGGERTRVRAFEGECEITDHRQTVKLGAREQATFADSAREGSAKAVIEPLAPRNAFESWAQDRNRRLERSASLRHVSPEMIGYHDLDDYGDWVYEVDYGYVWYPRQVALGWAPYRYGHWIWVSPWGWTWVDDAPWGFAPFHYGRWAHIRGRWCWVPGPLHVRPVYAPALVAWVGGAPIRSGVSVTVSFGDAIGWFPLGPREIYVPSYRCSRRYLYNVNYSNTIVVNSVYINRVYSNPRTHFDHMHRRLHEAVTVVRAETFRSSRPVREHWVQVDHRELRAWDTHNVLPEIRPLREHRHEVQWRGTHREPNTERTVVMRNAPASVDRLRHTPLRERSEQVERSGREPPMRHLEAVPADVSNTVARSEHPHGDIAPLRERTDAFEHRPRELRRFEERYEPLEHRERFGRFEHRRGSSMPHIESHRRQIDMPTAREPVESPQLREHIDRGVDRRNDHRARRIEFER